MDRCDMGWDKDLGACMIKDENGAWVKYSDVEALLLRVKELEAALDHLPQVNVDEARWQSKLNECQDGFLVVSEENRALQARVKELERAMADIGVVSAETMAGLREDPILQLSIISHYAQGHTVVTPETMTDEALANAIDFEISERPESIKHLVSDDFYAEASRRLRNYTPKPQVETRQYVATMTISFQTGYDSSSQELVHMICTESTTVAELMEWQAKYKHCLYASAISITSGVTKSEQKEAHNG